MSFWCHVVIHSISWRNSMSFQQNDEKLLVDSAFHCMRSSIWFPWMAGMDRLPKMTWNMKYSFEKGFEYEIQTSPEKFPTRDNWTDKTSRNPIWKLHRTKTETSWNRNLFDFNLRSDHRIIKSVWFFFVICKSIGLLSLKWSEFLFAALLRFNMKNCLKIESYSWNTVSIVFFVKCHIFSLSVWNPFNLKFGSWMWCGAAQEMP